ncbi:hypothetical protein GR925_25920 [Streptomyces sp. HUCO-GS316]|uniref:hypothetical protein n=1 Tax=Streptomyces sp. HUCO-GS316 TaxID=2692198 RepID=UPI001367FB38|nr:hypothetical protein [Streptomyces sp. HUCO-GS316]MXM66775.1 hypothetical protein [Streptomyces sp. HUCO-GS316]
MSRITKSGVYVLLLLLGLSLTPAHVFDVTLKIAIVGLCAMVLVQLRSTRTTLDYAFAWVALWAVVAVLGAPLIPLWHNLGELLKGAAL